MSRTPPNNDCESRFPVAPSSVVDKTDPSAQSCDESRCSSNYGVGASSCVLRNERRDKVQVRWSPGRADTVTSGPAFSRLMKRKQKPFKGPAESSQLGNK